MMKRNVLVFKDPAKQAAGTIPGSEAPERRRRKGDLQVQMNFHFFWNCFYFKDTPCLTKPLKLSSKEPTGCLLNSGAAALLSPRPPLLATAWAAAPSSAPTQPHMGPSSSLSYCPTWKTKGSSLQCSLFFSLSIFLQWQCGSKYRRYTRVHRGKSQPFLCSLVTGFPSLGATYFLSIS